MNGDVSDSRRTALQFKVVARSVLFAGSRCGQVKPEICRALIERFRRPAPLQLLHSTRPPTGWRAAQPVRGAVRPPRGAEPRPTRHDP